MVLKMTAPSLPDMDWMWYGLLSEKQVQRVYDNVLIKARLDGSRVSIYLEPR